MLQAVYIHAKDEDEAGPAVHAPGPAPVGRLVDSSQADDRRMIRLVRVRRLLYARNNMPVASYYTHVKSLWEEVAQEMGWTVGEVRRKWSHIRNSYSRHLRNELGGARTGRGRAVSRWYLADELEFLREHMATDTRSVTEGYGPSLLEMEMSEQASEVDVKPPPGVHWMVPPPAPRVTDVRSEADESCSSQGQQFSADENSSFFQFFRGIHEEYQELSSARRRRFKRQVLECLHQLLDEQEAAGGGAEGGRPRTPTSPGSSSENYSSSVAVERILP